MKTTNFSGKILEDQKIGVIQNPTCMTTPTIYAISLKKTYKVEVKIDNVVLKITMHTKKYSIWSQ